MPPLTALPPLTRGLTASLFRREAPRGGQALAELEPPQAQDLASIWIDLGIRQDRLQRLAKRPLPGPVKARVELALVALEAACEHLDRGVDDLIVQIASGAHVG